MAKPQKIEIGAQPGPQSQFLSTKADIAVYGGSAGGGKTYAVLLECLRHVSNPYFGAVIFRKQLTQVTSEGGLWHEALKLYTPFNVQARRAPRPEIEFKSGARVSFGHLDSDDDVYGYQGAQIPLMCFDQLEHFSAFQFWYMLSRNRSTCGVRPYVRATANPVAGSWLLKLIDWWIDPATGYPIKERAGIIRHFAKVNDALLFADTPEQAGALGCIDPSLTKSFTFIPATIYDNRKLLDADPGYLANLNALDDIQRERLLSGNWKITYNGGMINPEWFPSYDAPGQYDRIIQSWDTASKAKEVNDFSVGITFGQGPQNIDILDVTSLKYEYPALKQAVIDKAEQFKPSAILIESAGSGIALFQELISSTRLPVMEVRADSGRRITGIKDKVVRMSIECDAIKAGRVRIPKSAAWAGRFLAQLAAFPEGLHDDDADALSQGLRWLRENPAGGHARAFF